MWAITNTIFINQFSLECFFSIRFVLNIVGFPGNEFDVYLLFSDDGLVLHFNTIPCIYPESHIFYWIKMCFTILHTSGLRYYKLCTYSVIQLRSSCVTTIVLCAWTIAKIKRCWARSSRWNGCAHIYAELLPHTKLRPIVCNGAWILQLYDAASGCVHKLHTADVGWLVWVCARARVNRVCCADEHSNRICSDQTRCSQRMCFLLKIRRHCTRLYLRIFVHNVGNWMAKHPFYMRSIVSLQLPRPLHKLCSRPKNERCAIQMHPYAGTGSHRGECVAHVIDYKAAKFHKDIWTANGYGQTCVECLAARGVI